MKTRASIAIAIVLCAASALAVADNSTLVQLGDDLHVEADPGSQYGVLVGTATNVSGHSLAAAVVTLNLFDAQNTLVGNAAAVQQQIGTGQKWSYRAYPTARFDHAAVSNVTAY